MGAGEMRECCHETKQVWLDSCSLDGEWQLAYPEFAAFFSKKPLIWPMGVKEEPPPTRPRPPARSLPLPESEEADAAQKVDSRQHSIKSGERTASIQPQRRNACDSPAILSACLCTL